VDGPHKLLYVNEFAVNICQIKFALLNKNKKIASRCFYSEELIYDAG